jgi:hypothetical protein
MTIEFEETVSEDRLAQGELLQEILNQLEAEKKNAIIGFRCVNKDIPQSLDNEDLQWVDFKSSIDTLAMMGVCYVDENDMQELLRDFKDEVGKLYSDHRAWSILTVLEVDDYKHSEESYYEANIYSRGSKSNSIPIDLVCESDEIGLVTCKFNITNQRDAAKEKAEELNDVCSGLEVDCTICLGTLNPKIKERIENQVGEVFDEIVSGVDILEFE